jgi:hypothetical protein
MPKSRFIEEVMPIWKIENDCILDKQGSVTVGFSVSLPEIFTLSAADYEAMHSGWVRAIKVLQAGTILHKQDWFIEERYRARLIPLKAGWKL